MSRLPEGIDRNELYVVARRVLLDALIALRDQSDAVMIVGAQAIYLRSIDVELAVASFTSDADLGLDPDRLADVPLLEGAMTAAGFARDVADHAGSWIQGERVGSTVVNIAVDLLVPENFSGGGRRSVRIPPHDRMSARRVAGLEPAVVDYDMMKAPSLEPDSDDRVIEARVAGVAALFVAKAYKITQRVGEPGQSRLTNKDAGDVLRLMMATAPEDVVERCGVLLADDRSAEVTRTGLGYLQRLFGAGATVGTEMAVSALSGAVDGDDVRAIAPAYVAALCAELG